MPFLVVFLGLRVQTIAYARLGIHKVEIREAGNQHPGGSGHSQKVRERLVAHWGLVLHYFCHPAITPCLAFEPGLYPHGDAWRKPSRAATPRAERGPHSATELRRLWS